MPSPLPWIERQFTFRELIETYAEVIERCRGTPARVEERVRGLSREVLIHHDGAGWSIQENIGHLIDLEPLWDGRLDDMLAGKAKMRAADMTNQATNEGEHNGRDIEDLIDTFRGERGQYIARLEALSMEDFARTAQHPRLDKSMRLLDTVSFVCAHDDYHLARISELRRALA